MLLARRERGGGRPQRPSGAVEPPDLMGGAKDVAGGGAAREIDRGAVTGQREVACGEGRSGDLPSVERAASELRRAGFSEAVAEGGVLEHRFTVEGFIAFLSEFDEETLFQELEPDLRRRVLDELGSRLRRLSGTQMTMRFPIVFASGRRSRR